MPFAFRDLAIDYLGTWRHGEYRSVDAVCRELSLIDGKRILSKKDLPITGGEFWKEIDEDYNLSAAGDQYLRNDVRMEYAITKALQI